MAGPQSEKRATQTLQLGPGFAGRAGPGRAGLRGSGPPWPGSESPDPGCPGRAAFLVVIAWESEEKLEFFL